MLITKTKLKFPILTNTALRCIRNTMYDLPSNQDLDNYISNLPNFDVTKKTIYDIDLPDQIFGRSRYNYHHEKLWLIQVALNILRVLDKKETISLVYCAPETAIYKISDNMIILQIDSHLFKFIENCLKKKKDFWNCMSLLHDFIMKKNITIHNIRNSVGPEACIKDFPKSNLGIEYISRESDDEGISQEDLINLIEHYNFDDMTIKTIRELIDA